jgi:sulfatase modifying factor 1
MSAAVDTYRDDVEATYAVDFSRDREPIKARKRFPEYRRKGGAPTRVNGMHCRRSKRWSWGSGRGARMLNLRAFAGAVAFAVASVASTVLGVTIDYATIGNPGNPGNAASSPAGLGAVSDLFLMSTKEVTNAQYAEFLNAVGASNTNSVYNANMGSNVAGGIVQSGSPGSFTYAVKGGTGPAGSTYASMPVNFVSWYSAARFVNWLANGQQTGPAGTASMETGSYTLNNAISGNVPTRNGGATVFLPSVNEWYKAAFYSGAGSVYTTYQTNSNTAPTGSLNFALANQANFNNVAASATAVASYTATQSAYGLYDMMGNVTEYLDTVNPSNAAQAARVGGNFTTLTSQLTLVNATAPILYGGTGATVNNLGFRVAAVPEPSTIALAGVGIASLAGYEWSRRRKAKAQIAG